MMEADKSTFWQRFTRMLRICGPQAWPSLFASRSELELAKQVVLGGGEGMPRDRAQYLVDTSVHPDTGEIMPLPFRMAAHVPANTVLLIGMLTARSPLATGLSQFANQSFNAAQFWVNRNASNTVAPPVLALSFLGAVTASVGLGVVLRRWELAQVAKAGMSLWRRRTVALVGYSVPLIAAAAAKPVQIALMRADELLVGVTVSRKDGSLVRHPGSDAPVRSVVAGWWAVGLTVSSRVLYLVPPMVLPQLIMLGLQPVLRMAPPAVTGAVFVSVVASLSAITTPVCMALWDQRTSLPLSAFEPHVRSIVPGESELYFNKGL
jgi:sideroflexin-5